MSAPLYPIPFKQPTLRACLLAAGLLVGTQGAYAACGIDGIPEQYRPLGLSQGTTNTMGQPGIGGEAASARAESECREKQDQQSWYQTLGIAADERTETLLRGTADSFRSGGSFVFDLLAAYKRAYDNPADLAAFDPQAWLDENREKDEIEMQYLSTFAGARSEAEANALLVDVNEREAAQARVQRMGTVARFTVKAVTALPDIAIALCGLALLSIPARSVFRRTSAEKPEGARAGN